MEQETYFVRVRQSGRTFYEMDNLSLSQALDKCRQYYGKPNYQVKLWSNQLDEWKSVSEFLETYSYYA